VCGNTDLFLKKQNGESHLNRTTIQLGNAKPIIIKLMNNAKDEREKWLPVFVIAPKQKGIEEV